MCHICCISLYIMLFLNEVFEISYRHKPFMPKRKYIVADRGAIIVPKKMNTVSIILPDIQSISIFSNCNVLYSYIFKSRIQSVVHLLHLVVRLYWVLDKYVSGNDSKKLVLNCFLYRGRSGKDPLRCGFWTYKIRDIIIFSCNLNI